MVVLKMMVSVCFGVVEKVDSIMERKMVREEDDE